MTDQVPGPYEGERPLDVALDVLGHHPGVRLVSGVADGAPHAVVAIEAGGPAEAHKLARELLACMAKGAPEWRGWAIQYKAFAKPDGPPDVLFNPVGHAHLRLDYINGKGAHGGA